MTTAMTFTVTLEIETTDVENAEEQMPKLFAEYLTEEGSNFLGDYSPTAWGGYQGPWVTGVTVSQRGVVVKEIHGLGQTCYICGERLPVEKWDGDDDCACIDCVMKEVSA